MSDEDKMTPSKSAAGPNSPKPESPTTARPLDFDDEPQETGVTTAPPQQTGTEAAPPKPPRPVSPRQQAETTLKEAFPTIEASVVRAVLVASNWDVERAFHALLGMTDPNAQQEDIAPPKPPRPSAAQRQLEADELYARQLAEHYNRRAPQTRWDESRHDRARRGSDQSEEREYSFFDDDLPVIRENIRKGFLETQSKVNSWVQNLKKRLDGEDVDEGPSNQRYGEGQGYSRPRRSGDMGRRSGDRERYDADPQLLSDDFSALELRDSEAPPPQPPRRPLANPNLYKSASPSPDRRKVSFQEGPPSEIGNLYDTSDPAKRTSTGGKSSKWQPLATVEPSPVAENDPFSLGDSEDERDTKGKEQNNADEADRIKKATAEAMAGKDQAFDILAQIARIEKKTFPANEAFPFGEDLWKKKPNTRVLYAVSTASGVPHRLVAYAVYVRQKGVALLHKVCVVEAFRRQGIGMQLMNYIRQRLQKEGCQYIQLWVDKAREPARSLYNRSGFDEREEIADYYAPGRTGIRMVLDLERG
ncbi:hypothetical protein CNMCM8927_007134 [Aspergillus lentulus]|uniref:CUE domain-containing protein 5 n=1 Tax=Aspergillus lentulus TaxID=293939 RepID=A0AAN6BNV8_ASPLE|nr:hypothetical protein CNMCM8694_007291 [Aspergillus lentulus]KAF4204749.1 hypothetical protein CNMCM8927_007134 [Aspergillus lentulus]